MTVRELIKQLVETTQNLDAEVEITIPTADYTSDDLTSGIDDIRTSAVYPWNIELIGSPVEVAT